MINIIPSSPHKDFESIKKNDNNSIEYWEARELMFILEYLRWENFFEVIKRAKIACTKSGQDVISHFREFTKMVKLGSGATRNVTDYKLSRYACYLIAQNGDPSKQSIANAQTYFAIQTRKQEVGTIEEDTKRVFIREEVKKQNKVLASTVSKAGVSNFGQFNDMGYLGLYGLHIPDIKKKKGIANDESILDRAGSAELAANLFRITQTEEKIKKEKITGQGRLSGTHFSVGSKVREAIEKIGGETPENLPTAPNIKLVQKRIKNLSPKQQKLIK